ncbi:aliphatic sulfonate ABC transporter substrate-binding protein [Hymenobacter tibetensis]|uniref:Aliphatic sulfonate ABC transporter substrate-binding protein n=1 Tax=Hymenobacter tibetensis TaxID=497967 RepID=A0ABY4CVY0_9BACT|nr:aliphatic sulfonate ABC transporter substrate-binding protein [Hymenobacter tibetensis]UOG74425.1 aliphatic sulfonate ABC transporter substrate-binding protein [Hymenobacter tibetensis]
MNPTVPRSTHPTRSFSFAGGLVLLLLLLAGCGGAGSETKNTQPDTIRLDYAYYNPLSLVLKEQGWLEKDLAKQNIKVEWVLSQGSNKALEFLNGSSIDFGSTAGAAALIGKANGNPLKAIYIYSKPEWTALCTGPKSTIKSVADLKGKRVAATRGTDPYIFLLRALDQAGLSEKDIELIPLQHPDGRAALEKGDVDAWAGLDPHMAKAELESGAQLFYRNADFNSYGVLNVREEFAKQHPALVDHVLAAYEQARQWAVAHPAELKKTLATEAKLSEAVAAKQLERTDLTSISFGPLQRNTISAAGDVLKKSGAIDQNVDINQTVSNLIDTQFADKIAPTKAKATAAK